MLEPFFGYPYLACQCSKLNKRSWHLKGPMAEKGVTDNLALVSKFIWNRSNLVCMQTSSCVRSKFFSYSLCDFRARLRPASLWPSRHCCERNIGWVLRELNTQTDSLKAFALIFNDGIASNSILFLKPQPNINQLHNSLRQSPKTKSLRSVFHNKFSSTSLSSIVSSWLISFLHWRIITIGM